MCMSDSIVFWLNGERRVLPADTLPMTTLLDWLRGPAGMTGTKEGCAEGDCGACTVVLELPEGGRTAVNSCILTLGQMHGRRTRTVEGLRGADDAPHSVQTAMAESHATQCGFCTPGIIMTAWAHATEGGDPHEALAGNLCRCTGYRPILEAFTRLEPEAPLPVPSLSREAGSMFRGGGQSFHRPTSLAELIALRRQQPDAWLLAGGTDLGLRISVEREVPAAVICTLDVPELNVVDASPAGLRIGAAVPYRRLLSLCAAEPGFGPLADLLRRLGSRQIRSMGTLGGNLGTASPIGDALPPLLALDAIVTLAGPAGVRELPVDDFLLGYRRTALRDDGEVIRDIRLPRPLPNAFFACDKLSRRHDQDIATVGLSVHLVCAEDRIIAVRVAHGGLGPKCARSPGAEAAFNEGAFAASDFDRAAQALMDEITPLDDVRATAHYRKRAAGNLLRRLWWRWSEARAA
jgi:xanthine dehydrogenase small subunit